MTLILAVLVGAAILIGGIWWFIRQQHLKDVWEGVIREKTVQSVKDNDGHTSQWHYLHIQTPSGQLLKKRVSQKVYDQMNVGDRAVKVAGQIDPTRV